MAFTIRYWLCITQDFKFPFMFFVIKMVWFKFHFQFDFRAVSTSVSACASKILYSPLQTANSVSLTLCLCSHHTHDLSCLVKSASGLRHSQQTKEWNCETKGRLKGKKDQFTTFLYIYIYMWSHHANMMRYFHSLKHEEIQCFSLLVLV